MSLSSPSAELLELDDVYAQLKVMFPLWADDDSIWWKHLKFNAHTCARLFISACQYVLWWILTMTNTCVDLLSCRISVHPVGQCCLTSPKSWPAWMGSWPGSLRGLHRSCGVTWPRPVRLTWWHHMRLVTDWSNGALCVLVWVCMHACVYFVFCISNSLR